MNPTAQNLSITQPISEGSTVQEVAPGLFVQWLADRHIVVITNAGGASRNFVDAWFNTLSTIMREWAAEQPFLLLQDLSDKSNVVTVYSRQRAAELYKVRPELEGRVAVIVPQNLMTQLVRLFLRMQQHKLQIEVFFSREEGLHWLQQEFVPSEVEQPFSSQGF